MTVAEWAVSSVTVAMATYQRPDDVAVVLPLLVEQACSVTERTGIDIDVLVVDNDPSQGARHVVVEHAGARYVAEPEPGISAARNRALTESNRSDLLAFIDDDERPEPGWLSALLETWRRTQAAAVAGPVRTEFTGRLHPWIASGGFLSRGHRTSLCTGDEISQAATNNLLLDLRQVRATGLQFDVHFGLSGGGDSLFTRALTAAGGRIVWCAEAVVTERIRADRLNVRWMLARALRYGNTDVRVGLALNSSRSTSVPRVRGVIGGLSRVMVGSVRWSAGVIGRSVRRRALGAVTIARGVGMILGAGGYVYREYRRA